MTSRLSETRALLARVRERSEAVLVGLSGGKDSLVTLDLCAEIFPRVEAWFMYLVDGLRVAESMIDYCERRYRRVVPTFKVHRVPHWMLSHYFKHAIYRSHVTELSRMPAIKFIDIEHYVQDKSGILWNAMGHRMADSLERRGMLHKLAGIDEKAHRVYPLWQWSKRDVYAYLRAKRIPLPTRLDDRAQWNTSGIRLSPDTIRALKTKFPADYKKILEVFPYAEAVAARERFRGQVDPVRPDDSD